MEKEYVTKKQLLKSLVESLEYYLSSNGFTTNATNELFFKSVDKRVFKIHLVVKNYWPLKQDFNILLGIVFEDINIIITKFLKGHLSYNYDKKFELTTFKYVLPHSNQLGFKEIFTSNDINQVCSESLKLIEQNALLFFESNSSYSSVGEYYIEMFEKRKYYLDLVVALIASKFDNNSDYFKIQKRLINFISNEKTTDIPKEPLMDLIKYLDNL